MASIAVIITCHNRKVKTLRCLESLFNQKGIADIIKLDVFLVDDGSTDGTSDAVNSQFPEVKIIKGTGDLYWNRGMHLAWKTASDYSEYDYYLWLNDDTFLFDFALIELVESSILMNDKVIICGTTCSKETDSLTYGGYLIADHILISPNGIIQKCDYFNGNCVLIPNYVFKRLGNLDPYFHHAIGDFEYSLRSRKLGLEIYVARNIIGNCEYNHGIKKCWDPYVELIDRIRFLYGPLSGCNPIEFFVYEKTYFGYFIAIKHFIYLNIRVLFPLIYKLK